MEDKFVAYTHTQRQSRQPIERGRVRWKGKERLWGGDEKAQGLLSAERFNAHVQRYRLVQMEVCVEFRVGWSCVSRRVETAEKTGAAEGRPGACGCGDPDRDRRRGEKQC